MIFLSWDGVSNLLKHKMTLWYMETLDRPGVSLKTFLWCVAREPGHADFLHAFKSLFSSTASLQFWSLAVGGARVPVFDRAGAFQH